MVFCCGADLGLFAAAAGVGLRDLQSGGYSRDTLDYIYVRKPSPFSVSSGMKLTHLGMQIVSKFTLWSSGMLAEAFFVLRVWMVRSARADTPSN